MSDNQKEPRGVCYICNGDCNPCSQTCGSCARDLTMVMIGMKNTDNVKPDVEKYLESLYNEPTVNTLSTDNFPREQANLEYDTLIERYPTYERMEEVYLKKAGNAYISGKYDRAIEDYNKILQLFPDTKFRTDIVFGLGSSYDELDDFEKAKQNYLQIKDTYPSPKVIDIRLAGIVKRRQKKSYRDTKL